MLFPALLVFLAPVTAGASPVCSHRSCEVLSWVSETLPAVGRCASPEEEGTMPWAARLQGSVHWEVGCPGPAEGIHTPHRHW